MEALQSVLLQQTDRQVSELVALGAEAAIRAAGKAA